MVEAAALRRSWGLLRDCEGVWSSVGVVVGDVGGVGRVHSWFWGAFAINRDTFRIKHSAIGVFLGGYFFLSF